MLIVGLGNPGLKYAKTHHNIGFMLVDQLAKELKVKFKYDKKFDAEIAEFKLNNEKHYLMKPNTYMNNSGISVGSFVNYYKLSVDDIFVIHDDLDLEFGKIRIRRDGSSGGHNGIKSIIQHLNSEKFKRMKIGIKETEDNIPVVDYVLSNLNNDEKSKIESIKEKILFIIEDLFTHDIEYVMNKYN